jgi:hypothetical protein
LDYAGDDPDYLKPGHDIVSSIEISIEASRAVQMEE